eukprot:5115676-Prymnesium_polylepis.1
MERSSKASIHHLLTFSPRLRRISIDADVRGRSRADGYGYGSITGGFRLLSRGGRVIFGCP